ncbi:MAG: hypothetical protein Q3980_07225 [Turicibacter sp.]|nr:hypothetical protein [Turicibacter sp.]
MVDFILILLPVVVVGIAVILFINNVKKTNEKRTAFEDEKANQNEENPEENYMAIGMLFGVAIGTIFFNAESRPYGICFGMLFGMVIGMSIKKK